MKINVIEPKGRKSQKIRAGAYCRVSSDHDDQMSSVENQKRYYKELIESNPEYELVEIYSDSGISGRSEKRPGFQKMMQDVRDGKVDLILTKSISRFARNTTTVIGAIQEFRKYGVDLFFELQNMSVLDPQSDLLITIYAAFAQAESENTSELLELSHLRRVSNGNHNTKLCGLYGYSKDTDGGYYPDENAQWVKKMYEMAAQHHGPTYIARYLNAMGVKPKNAKKFSGTVVNKIITNPTYKGLIVREHYYKDAFGKTHRNDGTHPALVEQGDHVPIISEDLWNKANETLLRKTFSYEEMVGYRKQYKGRVFCGICGYVMHGAISKREQMLYFRCSGSANYGIAFCPAKAVPLSELLAIGPFKGNLYIWQVLDAFGMKLYPHQSEEEWRETHQKKPRMIFERDMETASLEGKLFCRRCNSQLLRRAAPHRGNTWICEGNKRHGAEYCKGIKMKDTLIKGKHFEEFPLFLWERTEDGEKSYYYSTKGGNITKL